MKTVGCLIFALVGLAAAEPIFFELFNKEVLHKEQPSDYAYPGQYQAPGQVYAAPELTYGPPEITNPGPQAPTWQHAHKPFPFYKPTFEIKPFNIPIPTPQFVPHYKPVPYYKPEYVPVQYPGYPIQKPDISDKVTGFKQGISDKVTGFTQGISDKITGFKQGISDKVTDKVTGVKNAATGIKSHVNYEINKKVTGIQQFGDGIKEIGAAVGGAFHGLKQDFINKHVSKPQYVLVPARPQYPQGPYVPQPGPEVPSLTYGAPEFQ